MKCRFHRDLNVGLKHEENVCLQIYTVFTAVQQNIFLDLFVPVFIMHKNKTFCFEFLLP